LVLKKKKSSFKKKVIRKLLSHPPTLFLFLAGMTDLAALWALQIDSGVGLFAGIACILGSLGLLVSRWFLSSDELTEEVVAEIRDEAKEDHENKLDQLEERLSADQDPRTETQLKTLRDIMGCFHHSSPKERPLFSRSSFDILSGVQQLFSGCVFSLEKSLQLWHTAMRMQTEEGRNLILDQRERIIGEIDQSIRQLGKILAEIQILEVGSASEESDLARIRKELNQSLKVAKNVEERMRSLDSELQDSRRKNVDAAKS
jgi:hypothetical protein